MDIHESLQQLSPTNKGKFIIQRNTFQVTYIQNDEFYHQHLTLILKVQKSYRWKKFLKRFRTSLKRHKYRKNIIKELIDTEE